MVEILSVIKNIGQAKGVVGFVIGCKSRSGNLRHREHPCHKLLHVFIFRAKLSVRENLNLDSAVRFFLYLLGKFRHCNMNGVRFAQTMAPV